jgi:Mrp family chromosome partitioning ATPase
MKDAGVEPYRFEPTVFSAVRRYRTMVLAVAILAMAAAVGYTLMQPKVYRAQASISVPEPGAQANLDTAQYLDTQVLILTSQTVAQRAAGIANNALRSNRLAASDFSGDGSSLVITPPMSANPGIYGDSIIGVSFTGPSASIAQAGANAVLQAFVDTRSAAIIAQANATIASLTQAMTLTSDPNQQSALMNARTQTVIDEDVDLAQHKPTVLWAQVPTSTSGSWKLAGVIGFVIGIVLGAALAYARASFRRGFAHPQDPAALYGVPLIGEIPAFEAQKTWRSNGSPSGHLLPMIAEPHSAVAEAFRFAAGSVERIRNVRGPRLSLVFVSPLEGAGKSMVVANLALAIAEGGTRVLVVDADAAYGDLTARLLPGTPTADGFEQVLAGQQAVADCVQPSPFNSAVAVLGSGPPAPSRVTGAARSKAAGMLLAEAKASFDIVLIDSPALLQVADATELVDAADAAITVLSPDELIRDHLEMVDRLKLIGSDVVGYIYNRAPMRSHLARYRRNGSTARPTLVDDRPIGGQSHPSSQPPAHA